MVPKSLINELRPDKLDQLIIPGLVIMIFFYHFSSFLKYHSTMEWSLLQWTWDKNGTNGINKDPTFLGDIEILGYFKILIDFEISRNCNISPLNFTGWRGCFWAALDLIPVICNGIYVKSVSWPVNDLPNLKV